MSWAKLGLKRFDARGRGETHVFRPKRRPCRMVGGTRPTTKDGLVSPEPWMAGGDLCSAPLMQAPLEPSLAVHSIKEVRFCKREVPGQELEGSGVVEDVRAIYEGTLRVPPR